VGTFSTCEGNDEAIAHPRLHNLECPPTHDEPFSLTPK